MDDKISEKNLITEYTSYDAFDELEEIRATLHDAKRKINRSKLEKSEVDVCISFTFAQ